MARVHGLAGALRLRQAPSPSVRGDPGRTSTPAAQPERAPVNSTKGDPGVAPGPGSQLRRPCSEAQGAVAVRRLSEPMTPGANCYQNCYPSGPAAPDASTPKGPATHVSAGHRPFARRRMGVSNPRGLSPNTLSKCLNGGWEVFAAMRFRRSARCADGSHDPWMGLDREELLPRLLPVRPVALGYPYQPARAVGRT